MNRTAIALIAALGLGLASGAVGADAQKIRIGTEGAFPPFNFIDVQGQVQGFDIDVANALCEAMKAECTYVTQDWDGLIPGLLVRKYDAIIAGMSITEERKQRVAFTKPYLQPPIQFVAKQGSGLTISKEGLKGKTIGVQRGTISSNYLEQNYADAVKIQYYDTQENANLDLASGRVDAVIADKPVMQLWLKEHGGGRFELIGEAISDPQWVGEGFGIALRPKDQELLASFNQAIDQIHSDGTLDKIYAKWFGE